MKPKILILILGSCMILSPGRGIARDEGPPLDEVHMLRERIARLEERISQMEAILKAKEIIAPSKIDRPEAWTTLKVKVNADGVMRLDDIPLDEQGLLKAIQRVFRDGKFPDVSLSASADVSYDKIQHLLKILGSAGVSNVSFETSSQ